MPPPDRPPALRQNDRLRVLLLLSSLHGGGAERVAVHLHRRLDPARFDVRMGLLRAAGPYFGGVDRARLLVAGEGDRFDFDGSNSSHFAPMKLLRGAIAAPRAFREMIDEVRPHVVLSFLKGTNLIVWRALAGARPRPKWIAREGSNVLAVIRDEAPFPLAARTVAALTARAYRRADRVLAIADRLRRDIARDLRLDPRTVEAIHNPVDIAGVHEAAKAHVADRPNKRFVLAAGRLEYQKGFDLLLRAFAASGVAATHDLVILGQGSLAAELETLAAELGIASRVHWPGFQANPFAWMAACELFVLPSRWEGFGNVLAEAMAAGAPVLAADCDYGPGEIVTHGESGWLVAPDSAEALTAGLRRLLGDAALRDRLAAGARRESERFAIEPIVGRYAALLDEVAGR
ncbi:MAG: glycosyltransferase [Novosphingobium sp.]|nr:glycosyltransferase [Novosphingobium sp.]